MTMSRLHRISVAQTTIGGQRHESHRVHRLKIFNGIPEYGSPKANELGSYVSRSRYAEGKREKGPERLPRWWYV